MGKTARHTNRIGTLHLLLGQIRAAAHKVCPASCEALHGIPFTLGRGVFPKQRGKENRSNRESGGDRWARLPVTLTASVPCISCRDRLGRRHIKFVRRRARNRTVSPSRWGAEFFLSFAGHCWGAVRFRLRSTSRDARRGGSRLPSKSLQRYRTTSPLRILTIPEARVP